MKTAWVVFHKELIDAWRDKRTWRAMIILPIFLTILVVATGVFAQSQARYLQKELPVVAINGSLQSPVARFLASTGQVKLEPATPESRDKLFRDTVQVIMTISGDEDKSIASGGAANIQLSYNDTSQKSSVAQGILGSLLDQYAQDIIEQRLAAKGLPLSIIHPVNVRVLDVATKAQQGESMLATFLPILLGAWAVSGGTYAAIDAGAGEKERGTLEALYIAIRSKGGMVAGKYLVVVLSSLFSSLLSMISLYVASIAQAWLTGASSEVSVTFSMNPLAISIMLLASIGLTGFISALQLATSIYARKFREAQTYLAPLAFAVLIPGILLQFLDVHSLSDWYFVVPVLGNELLVKEAILGLVDWSHLAIVLASSLFMTVLSLRLTRWLFQNEQVIYRH